jgi:glycosyltransferase involved in cell wall biosynthesis
MDSEYLKKFYDLKIPIYEIKNFPKNKEYIKSNLIRERFNISNDKKILLYQGVLLDGRGLIPIMGAIKNTEKYILVILGEGIFRTELEKKIKQCGIENKVKFAGNIDYCELHNWTCSADIGLCNIEPISFSYELALPNKLFEYILAELPVLATDLPALREVINSTNCGVIISKENNANDILGALDSILDSHSVYKLNSQKAKNQFTYESQKELILEIC